MSRDFLVVVSLFIETTPQTSHTRLHRNLRFSCQQPTLYTHRVGFQREGIHQPNRVFHPVDGALRQFSLFGQCVMLWGCQPER